MKHLFSGAALAALLAIAMPGSAQARMHGHHGWHHAWHHGWGYQSWYGPYAWGPVHARSDFMAARLNREEMGRIGFKGAVQ